MADSSDNNADSKPKSAAVSFIVPIIRTPLTDLGGSLINHQLFSECAERELEMMECMEAYGYEKGVQKCRFLIADFYECQNKTKQTNRIMAMREERERQIRAGILKGDKKYAPAPPLDSY